jgi:Protein of unknown function (DUF3618)
MDEGTGQVREDVGDEQRDPERIRADIEETREDLGETVEALAEKTDVKGQAKAKVDGAKESFSTKKDEVFGKARDATPESFDAQQAAAAARDNAIPLAVGALAAGFVIGRLTKR